MVQVFHGAHISSVSLDDHFTSARTTKSDLRSGNGRGIPVPIGLSLDQVHRSSLEEATDDHQLASRASFETNREIPPFLKEWEAP